MKIPRILLAAGASGSGKTLIACGLLQALKNRGLEVASFKCGPDYIDPMFHEQVIGTKAANLDTFFTSRECVRYLLGEHGKDADIAVIEGVMGYYDGVAGTSTWASAYDVADATNTPTILIVNTKGMSLSMFAHIKGFMEFKENSHIQGVIFNQMSPMLYPRMKSIAEEMGIRPLGYVPRMEEGVLESRHLGLVLPEEIPQLKENLNTLAEKLEKTLDIDGLIELANEANELQEEQHFSRLSEENSAFAYHTERKVRIGVAKDEAFCFFYKDNFRLLEKMGAELVYFSPIHDNHLPEHLDGMLLYGGYPELNAQALEDNLKMRNGIADAIGHGMPCMAECGGFMYLHDEMEDMDGNVHQMAGVIEGKAYRTNRLSRFGYITLENENADFQEKIPAHEFHYFDSTNCGDAFSAKKPLSERGWKCMHQKGRLLAGFPHFYYYGNPEVAKVFLENCLEYQKEREEERK